MSEVQPEVQPEPTPVVASTPSSQVPAEAPVVEAAPLGTFEAEVKAFVGIVEEGHKLGAREMSEALDRVKSFFGADS